MGGSPGSSTAHPDCSLSLSHRIASSPPVFLAFVPPLRDYVTAQRAKEKLECTFHPSLNPVTQSMGQAAPLDELVNNRRGLRVRERAQAKAR